MVLKKTCWLATIHPSRIGALIGTRGTIDLEPFLRFGFFVGAAFQIQDDILNLTGDARSYGKEIDGDIREGKRSLMLLRVLREGTAAERAEVTAIMCEPREQRTANQVGRVRSLMERYDCIEHARQIARGLAGAALHEYSLIYSGLAESRDKRFIEELATWVVERT